MSRLAISFLVVVLCLLAQGTAGALDGTGAELQHACNQPKGTQGHSVCVAFISGVYEGMWAAQRLLAGGYKTCLPGLGDDDLLAIVSKYMSARPQLLADPMAANVSASLYAEFSCK
jgi:hypothetical protein